mgnify:CR=1 FL=1
MNEASPNANTRLNEAVGIFVAALAFLLAASLISYHPLDPSWNTAASESASRNLIGPYGAHLADLGLQVFGLPASLMPFFLLVVAWKRFRSRPMEAPWVRLAGAVVLLLSACTLLGLAPNLKVAGGAFPAGGLAGVVAAGILQSGFNRTGAAILASTGFILSLYLVSSFSFAKAAAWLQRPSRTLSGWKERWSQWRSARESRPEPRRKRRTVVATAETPTAAVSAQEKPAAAIEEPRPVAAPEPEEIPIHTLEDTPDPSPLPAAPAEPLPAPLDEAAAVAEVPAERKRPVYELPSTELLNEPAGRNPYDEQELKEIAVRIKSKFEEFNVLGSVVQINPGPVVTTFEFKPEAGIKYSRITTLTEDLCLGLQAESILIERIPGKPTVGIEVPNTKREVIGLRQILESDEFRNSPARLPIPLGKDISGRIKVAALESMPHLLIAGSTGSGKSVMLNSMLMALLFRFTPEQVKLILVDPKRLELGLYDGIPHLLTPVITDAKAATNALRNAVLEMDRRFQLLFTKGVRNIEQYNRKIAQLQAQPKSLFTENGSEDEDLELLPYIVVFIDELGELMMVERGSVEESVIRLAQMARAVGIHLVLATQRPSVDVVTGLIKANFPARISFRVATRVDSRTILDVMGAEHLLGKGDMLFLPPGSSRLVRVHGALVTETEINRVVDFWKQQAAPEYDPTYLVAPPSEDEAENGEFDGEEDPLYRDAVRIVVDAGKASTSILQRRLRLGYGRAARILDMMQREGIIGPPDGSKPRDILKRPDWLDEFNNGQI